MLVESCSLAALGEPVVRLTQRRTVLAVAAGSKVVPLQSARFAPVGAADDVHVAVVDVEPLQERVLLCSSTGLPAVNELQRYRPTNTVVLPRENRRAPAVVVTVVERVVALFLLREPPWV